MWRVAIKNWRCLILLAVVLLLVGCGSTEPSIDEAYFQEMIDEQYQRYQAQERTSTADRITEFYPRPENDIANRRVLGMDEDLQQQRPIGTLAPEYDMNDPVDDFYHERRMRGMQEDLRRQQQQIDRLRRQAYDPYTKSRVDDLQRQHRQIDASVADRISGFPSRPEHDITANSRIRGMQEDIRRQQQHIDALSREAGGGVFGY